MVIVVLMVVVMVVVVVMMVVMVMVLYFTQCEIFIVDRNEVRPHGPISQTD
jgi:hypothetical protein